MRKNLTETIKSDLRCLEISWEKVELRIDRDEWGRCVAQDGLSIKYYALLLLRSQIHKSSKGNRTI